MVLRRSLRPPRTLRVAAAAMLAAGLALVLPGVAATPRVPRVVDVPSRPAFVKPPAASERPALVGQVLGPSTVLRLLLPLYLLAPKLRLRYMNFHQSLQTDLFHHHLQEFHQRRIHCKNQFAHFRQKY